MVEPLPTRSANNPPFAKATALEARMRANGMASGALALQRQQRLVVFFAMIRGSTQPDESYRCSDKIRAKRQTS